MAEVMNEQVVASQTQAVAEEKAVQTTAPVAPKQPVSKFGRQKTVEIKRQDGGIDTYLLQYPGVKTAMQILDNSLMPNGLTSRTAYGEQLLQEVVVEPAGLTLDDFDEREGINELIDAADEFLGEMWN